MFAEVWWVWGGGWEGLSVVRLPLRRHAAPLSGRSAAVPRHSGSHAEWVSFRSDFRKSVFLFLWFSNVSVFARYFITSAYLLSMIWRGRLAIELLKFPFSPLQQSWGTRVNEWSSPTLSCSSASSSATTSFPTTSTCARSFPAATWRPTPTCRAPAPPVMSPPTNPSARSRTQAAVSRWRHVGGICCGAWWVICATAWYKRVTQDYRLFNRTLVCRSLWKLITTPVLILMRYTQHLVFPSTMHT